MSLYTKYGRIYVICSQGDMRRSVPHSEAHDATAYCTAWPVRVVARTLPQLARHRAAPQRHHLRRGHLDMA